MYPNNDIIRLMKGDPYEKSNYNSNINNDRILCYTFTGVRI